jgi:hypothetical protein
MPFVLASPSPPVPSSPAIDAAKVACVLYLPQIERSSPGDGGALKVPYEGTMGDPMGLSSISRRGVLTLFDAWSPRGCSGARAARVVAFRAMPASVFRKKSEGAL